MRSNVTTDLRKTQKPLRARYVEDPAAARYTYRVGLADPLLDDPIHVTARSYGHPGPEYQASVNERIGGSGEEPTAGDLLLVALAVCKAMSIKSVAIHLGVRITSLEVDVDGDVDHRGVLMMPGARAGFEAIRCNVRIAVADGTDPATLEKLEHASEACCAATDTLRNPTPLTTIFDVRS